MIVDLSLVKKYLRLEEDYTEEDEILQLLIDNAEGYIYNTVENFNNTDTKQLNKAKLICMILVSDWYENRDLTFVGKGRISETVRYSIQSLITQLQYCYGSDEE